MNKEFRYTKIHLAKSPETAVLNLFCLIYALAKSKNCFYLQQCLVCQVMIFLERVRGNFYRKNVVNMHSESDVWIFVLPEINFRVMLVRNSSVTEINLHKMLLHASMNILQWRTQKIFMGCFHSVAIYNLCALCFWRHDLTSYWCFQTNVLVKFVDVVCISSTRALLVLCQCTGYELLALQVGYGRRIQRYDTAVDNCKNISLRVQTGE